MLEESKMDKKTSNRLSQSQSRASAIDCKKNTELTHKPWLRHSKKREGPNTSKNEPYRNNVPSQRGRGQVDRKNRIRESSSVYLMGGTENAGLEDEPEIGSVFVPGSKKQNLNHLLNFMYPTRGGGSERRRNPLQRRYVQQRLSHKHEFDLYLRSYCQFVVREDGDYILNLQNPDVPVKWEQIEEIVVRSAGRSECPICLGIPVAGRVGHCSHVYCWPCVLHYAAAHEKQPPPCPVCTTPLQVMEMKPARMLQWTSCAEEVTMHLVRRVRGSTTVEIAPPRGQLAEVAEVAILSLDKINESPYSKFFTATKQQVCAILDRERKEIQNQILAEIDTTEIVYLEQALELLKEKEEKINIKSIDCKEVKEIVEVTEETVPTVYEKQLIKKSKLDWFDVNDEGAACIDVIKDQMEMLDIDNKPDVVEFNSADVNDHELENEYQFIEPTSSPENDQNLNFSSFPIDIDKQNQEKYFYFYQADDGQQVFLHSLNVRILIASWGTLVAAPPIIRGHVLHRETLPLTEQTRKHMPYTAHLPLYCSFDVVELDLQPPYVTTAALNNYADELDRRARVRAKLQREERRRERAYRRAMEGPPKPDFSSETMFPPTAPAVLPCTSNSEPTEISPNMQIHPSISNVSPPTGISFAKIFGGTGAPFGNKCSNDVIMWRTSDGDAKLEILDVTGFKPPGQYGQAVLCYNGHFYTIGGTNGFAYNCDIFRLDLRTKVWEPVFVGTGQEGEPIGRYRHEVARVGDKLYIIGGGTGEWAFELLEIPMFDLDTKVWSVLVPKPDDSMKVTLAPLPRKCHSAVQIETPNGVQVFVAGGSDGQSVFEDIWRLNLSDLQWNLMQKTVLPHPLYFHSSTVTSHGCMYVFGGIEPKDDATSRNNILYKVWLCIPKLSEICWEALLHFHQNLHLVNRSSLLNIGVPIHFVDRIHPQLK